MVVRCQIFISWSLIDFVQQPRCLIEVNRILTQSFKRHKFCTFDLELELILSLETQLGLFEVSISYCTIGTFVFISIRKSLQALQPSLFQATVSVSVCWSISADRGSLLLKVTWFCFWMNESSISDDLCELIVSCNHIWPDAEKSRYFLML